MPQLLLLLLLLPAAEDAHRDAVARYGVGLLRARDDQPVQAVKQLEAAAKADPDSAEPLKPLVKLYAELGRYHAATRAARSALERDPDDADVAHTLGKLLYDGKKFADAAKALKQAADSPRLARQPAKRLGILHDLARANEAAKDWRGAEAALRAADKLITDSRAALLRPSTFATAAELDREAARVREQLGQALAAQKKFAEATAAFTEAHRLFAGPANDPLAAARLDWNLSGVLADAGKADEALEHLTKFLALRPANAEPYERYADLMRQLGRGGEVPAGLARLAGANPKNRSINWVFATELGKNNTAAGARQFHELLDDPRTTEPEFFRRLVHFDAEHRRAADLLILADRLFRAARGNKENEDVSSADRATKDRARAMAAAIRAEPGLAAPLIRQAASDAGRGVSRSADTWELVAGLAERDGQLAAAEALLRQATRNGAADRMAGLTLLQLLAKQRKWATIKFEVPALIAQLREKKTRSLAYEVYLATAHAELGEAEQALAVIERRVIGNVVGDGEAWARRKKAVVLNTLGRYKEAAAECRDLLDKFPAPKDAHETRAVLSNAYLGLKEYAKSEAELRKILDDDPDDVMILNNLGYNLADQGRKLPEAEELVRRAVELDRDARLRAGNPEPESGVYLDSLGWVLLRRGKLAEARTMLERAASLPDAATDAVVWDHLGDVCFRLRDRAAAHKAWEKAAELYTNSHQGRDAGRRDEVLRKLRQTADKN